MADTNTYLCESLIARDINQDCSNRSAKGLEADGVLINREDIDFGATVFDTANKNIIKTLALKAGKRGYKVKQLGSTPFTGTKKDLVKGTYVNTWTKTVALAVLENGPQVTRDVIDPISNGTFVAVLRNKTKGADGSAEYEIFGYQQGLMASEGSNDAYSDDTQGGYLMTLTEENAPNAGTFLFDTDAKTTAATYASLTTATA